MCLPGWEFEEYRVAGAYAQLLGGAATIDDKVEVAFAADDGGGLASFYVGEGSQNALECVPRAARAGDGYAGLACVELAGWEAAR